MNLAVLPAFFGHVAGAILGAGPATLGHLEGANSAAVGGHYRTNLITDSDTMAGVDTELAAKVPR